MKHASFFSGIGGFDYAAQLVGFENIFQVEIEKFPLKVLEKNFPLVKRYKDIKKIDFTEYRYRIDIVSGGFPCQPYSIAGKQEGGKDDRALWHEMLRGIHEIHPRWVVGENVANLVNMELEDMLLDLEAEGYEVQPVIIPAAGIGAPHKRNRVWIIANSNSDGFEASTASIEERCKREQVNITSTKDVLFAADTDMSKTSRLRKYSGEVHAGTKTKRFNNNNSNAAYSHNRRGKIKKKLSESARLGVSVWDSRGEWYEVATEFCRVDDGIPNRVDKLKGLGNAIVPQIAMVLFEAIKEIEKEF